MCNIASQIRFNSKLVRLEDQRTWGSFTHGSRFQFQIGAIRGVIAEPFAHHLRLINAGHRFIRGVIAEPFAPAVCAFQFQIGAIRGIICIAYPFNHKGVSIPNWCD